MAKTMKFVELHDGSILVLETDEGTGDRDLHRLDNPSGRVTTVPLPKKEVSNGKE